MLYTQPAYRPIESTKPRFVENETFYHKTAKLLLVRWLKALEERGESCHLDPFAWRKNYGVHSELKFYNQSNPYYFEQGKNRGRILFVPDITIFHKGQALYLIEVVHKNPVSHEKLFTITKFFTGYPCELHIITVDEIMKQTNTPTFLNTTRIL